MMKMLKLSGVLFSGLLMVFLIAFTGTAIYANLQFKRKIPDRPLYAITADLTPEGIARGKYLMEEAMDCTNACHTPEGGSPLSGVVEEIHQGPIQITFSAPNLTPDIPTGLGGWTDAEIARAIREGVDKDGTALVVMPSYNYGSLSDADVSAIIGYLRSLEPVNNPIPPFKANTFAKMMMLLGAFGPDPVQPAITAAQVTPEIGTINYGAYLVKLGACSDCHGANLAGGKLPFSEPDAPPAANLTPGGELIGWTVEDFIRAVREGVKPNGKTLADTMPRYGTSPEDLATIFSYLQTLPAAQPKQ